MSALGLLGPATVTTSGSDFGYGQHVGLPFAEGVRAICTSPIGYRPDGKPVTKGLPGYEQWRTVPHSGRDWWFPGCAGAPLFAPCDGEVVLATFSATAGNQIWFKDASGRLLVKWYHLAELPRRADGRLLKGPRALGLLRGHRFNIGERIATLGNTGTLIKSSTDDPATPEVEGGHHLHETLELLPSAGYPVDPALYYTEVPWWTPPWEQLLVVSRSAEQGVGGWTLAGSRMRDGSKLTETLVIQRRR